MDIWISWCRRTAKCHFCELPITVATPMVKGKLWKKVGEATSWSYRPNWHPQCWIEEGLVYLEQHPYQAKSTGRPKLKLSEADAEQRQTLVRRRSRLIYILREMLTNGKDFEHPSVIKILNRLLKLRIDIELFGGAPRSWDKPLIEMIPELLTGERR